MISLARLAAAAAVLIGGLALDLPAAFAGSGPPGFQILCIKQPAECVGGGASRIDATDSNMALLVRVNGQVNRAIRPKVDGRLDVWTVNASAGDCEDYALTKRRKLINAGIPASALRIAQVRMRDGQYHAILVVRTSRGQFVLDNLTARIVPLSQTPYRVIAIQTADPRQWS